MSAVLSVHELRKTYGSTVAVDGISFDVEEGEIVGLLGPNGAGKTTTIDILLGILTPTSGSVRIAGLNLAQDRSRAFARTNFAAVYATLPGNLTVAENSALLRNVVRREESDARIEELLRQFELERFRDVKIRSALFGGADARIAGQSDAQPAATAVAG